VLLSDNFIYLGTGSDTSRCLAHSSESFFVDDLLTPHAMFNMQTMIVNYSAGARSPGRGTPMLNPNFIRKVELLRQHNQNALVIFEDLSGALSSQIKLLADFLNPNWNVQRLVAYRPLYSWLHSVQSQRNTSWHHPNGLTCHSGLSSSTMRVCSQRECFL
jgi:hypothetical protein